MTTKYFCLNTNLETTCDVGDARDTDLSKTQGGSGTKVSLQTQSSTFVELLVFDSDVSGDSPATGNHDISIDVSAASAAAEFEYKFRAQAIDDAGCSVSANTAYSSIFTGTGIKTLIAASLTFAAGDERLRISVEGRKIGSHGNKSLTVNTGDVDSFILAPWTAVSDVLQAQVWM